MLPFPSGMLAQAPGGVVGPYGGHSYWRLYVTNTNGGTNATVGGVTFLDSGGSPISTTGGTATCSSNATGGGAGAAFDGDSSTIWRAASAANEWVAYQFSSPVGVAKIILYTATAGTDLINRAPKDCKLQYSDDGSTWSDAFSFSNYLPVQGYGETYPYTAPASGYHRGWRLLCDNANGGTSIRIDELELRATASGADQTTGTAGGDGNTIGRAIGSSAAVGSSPGNAFNDTTGVQWISVGNTNQWVGNVFPAAKKVEEISVQIYTDPARAPKDMHLQYSDDGITWTTQKDLASQTGWVASETRVLAAI